MKIPTFAALLCVPAAAVAAEPARDDALKLPDVLISANRQVESRTATSAANTVFTRSDIDRLQPTSVTDLLSRVPGVQVAPTGGRGSLPGIFIRGTKAAQSLVLVDGVRIANATSGDSGLQFLDVEQIERVEVLRGSRSAVYGSDAIGGVIQIFTRNAGKGLQQNLAITAGSNNLRQVSAGFSNRGERGWISAQGGYQETDGINACRGTAAGWGAGCFADEPDRDGYRNTSINVRGGYALTDTLSLEGHVLNADSFNEYDGSIFGGNEADNRQQVFGAKLAWAASDRFNLSAQVGRNRDEADNYFADASTGTRSFASAFDTRRDTASVQGDFSFAEGQQITAGADWQNDKVTSSTAFDIDQRDNLGVFAEYQGQFGAHSLQASVRNDDNEQFGNHTTGSLGYGFAFGNGFRLTASAGTGFKAPTFNDLYYPGFSNPNLKPEESKSLNLGIAQYADNWNWTFNAYETRVDQLIGYDSNFDLVNVAEARIRGAELTGYLSLAGFDINAQASFTDPRDHTSGAATYDNLLARRARTSGRLDVDKSFGPLRLGVTAAGSGHRFDNAANSVRLAGYGTMDVRVEYAINDAWSLQAKAANVFDREYETVAWYNQPGREYQLTLRYNSKAN